MQSFASPHETIRDVLAVLRSLNVRWKKIGPYNIKCMWKPKVKSYNMRITLREDIDCRNVPIQSSSKEVSSPCDAVKFEIQVIIPLVTGRIVNLLILFSSMSLIETEVRNLSCNKPEVVEYY